MALAVDVVLLLLAQTLFLLVKVGESGDAVAGVGGRGAVGCACREARGRRAVAGCRERLVAAGTVLSPLAGGAPLEGNGELVVEGHGVFELVFAGEDVASGTERVGRVARGMRVASLPAVALVLRVSQAGSIVVVVMVAVVDQGLVVVEAPACSARVVDEVGSRGLVAQAASANVEGEAAEEAKVRGAGDEGGVVGGVAGEGPRPGLGLAVAARRVVPRIAAALAVAHGGLAGGLCGCSIASRRAQEAIEAVTAPAQQAVRLVVVVPVVVEVEARLGPPARPPAVTAPVMARGQAGRGACADAAGDGCKAWVDVALREAVDVLLRRVVCVLQVLCNLLQRPVPARVTAAVHGNVDGRWRWRW